MSLLTMVQDILSDLSSDEVNSIDDTVESLQVAGIVRSTYFELMANRNWPHLRVLTPLENVSDTTRPNYLRIPLTIRDISEVKYNTRKTTDTRDKWSNLKFLEPSIFLDKVNGNNSAAANTVLITDDSGVTYYIRNDTSPIFWTSFDDSLIVLDSFDSVVDTTVQSSKVQSFGFKDPVWTHEDSFIPDLPNSAFPLLLAEAKSTSFEIVKQTVSAKSEQKAQRQKTWFAQKGGSTRKTIKTADYGRRGAKHGQAGSKLFEKN